MCVDSALKLYIKTTKNKKNSELIQEEDSRNVDSW